MRQQVLNRFLRAAVRDTDVHRAVNAAKRDYLKYPSSSCDNFQRVEKDAYSKFGDTDVERAARANFIARARKELEETEERAHQKLMYKFDQIRQQAREWAELVPTKFRIAQQTKETRTYTITSSPDCLNRLEKVMLTMGILGGWGASREVRFGWDGDGADYLDVKELKGKSLDDLESETEGDTVNVDALKIVEK